MRIYLGADWNRREQLQRFARVLQHKHCVTSNWLWTTLPDDDYRSHWESQAKMDCENIKDSELCIFFTEEPGTMSRGGRHFEFGYATALGKDTLVVGPVEMQFYTLADGFASDFSEVLLMLEEGLL